VTGCQSAPLEGVTGTTLGETKSAEAEHGPLP
jgi:hypothetical protein